ncbi:MAG: hypothetical protein JWQ71_2000 [Pedosphaera sp.]|nr:hypothetical protein [Pedosphaera sp.]
MNMNRPATAKFGEMKIFDSHLVKRIRKLLLSKLRIATRAGKSSHVRERLDFILAEQGDELFAAARRMPNGPDFCCSGGHRVLLT